ncbi:MAG: tetratricopeptide repeat protein [Myxococcaceae bacterium]|nr:tetratricopeptide repeat protein [Myxococcaceae bacterium]
MKVLRHVVAVLMLSAAGCKNAEQQAVDSTQAQRTQAVADGRAAMSAQDFEKAVKAFTKASSLAPNDPGGFLLLAQAHREAGNDGAAVMALKHAEELGAKSDPAVKRERAELYKRMGQTGAAITTLLEMRDANQLTDAELLMLAKLQARSTDTDGAFETLGRVQSRKPDDPDAKVTETEILLVKGDEVLAANLMDRLLKENPHLTSARVLRARYFLTNGYPELAEADLAQIGPEAQKDPEIVTFKARVFNTQKRYDEAATLLEPLVEKFPRDADLACQLAETKLLAGQLEEAQAMVDQALMQRDNFPRALYVRGRAYELQEDPVSALENYKYALKVDSTFPPVLSRIWRIYREKDEKGEAMGALEKLLFMKEATPDERIALAELYADTGINLERGRKLVDEQLKNAPNDQALKDLKKRLGRGKPKGSAIQIIRKRGR